MNGKKLGRREFLRLSAVAAAGMAAVACQPQTVIVKETVQVEKVVKETVEVAKEVTKVVEKEVTKVVEKEKVVKETVEVAQVSARQSPMFQELVKAGKLPSLEERLPIVPATCVDVPADEIDLEIGIHGGTCRMVNTTPEYNPYVFCMNNESLVRGPGLLGNDVVGNVVKGFQVTDGETVFTFYMREGMKWSDGQPVTTDDIVFAYQDVLLNKDLTPAFPQWLKSGNTAKGEPMKLEALDTYTFRITFAQPYGGFIAQLAISGWRGYPELLKPKHHLTQFHTKYTSLDKLEPLIQKEGFEKGEWVRLFQSLDFAIWSIMATKSIGFPRLCPWVPVSSTQVATILERNPYYFKVDREGKQLPYMDQIRSELVQDVEMNLLKIISGEVDFVSGGDQGASVKDIPVLKENEAKGGYRVVLQDMHVCPVDIFLNQTNADPVWRQVVRDVRFRKALCLGINREEIIDAVYSGFAGMPTNVPNAYDTATANKLLDEMGLNKKDADGFRLGPDGKTFEIPFEIAKYSPDHAPVTEMTVEFWKALGIKTSMKVIDAGLLDQRLNANELKAHVLWNHYPPLWWGAIWDVIPYHWGPLWNQWFNTGGEKGEEPPDVVKKLVQLIEQSLVVSQDQRQKMVAEHAKLNYDNIFIIYVVQDAKYPTVASTKMFNVPKKGFAINSSFSGEQFFFKM